MKPLSKRYSKNRRCPSCTKRITNANSIGMCKPCWLRERNTDPEFRQRIVDGQRLALNDPAYRAKKREVMARNRAKAHANPEYMARLRAAAPRLNSYRTPENEAKRIAALIAANKRRRHKWLPDELREEYFRMIRHGRFKAPEAKAIILEQIRIERERERMSRERMIANLSPFERQERALRNGAQLVANDIKPSLANPGIYEERKAG